MAEEKKKKVVTKEQDKAIMEILRLLKEHNLTLDIEHQIIIKPISIEEK